MRIRGDISISGDLEVTTRTSDPFKNPEIGRMLYAASDTGEVMWGDLKVPDLDDTRSYNKNSIVIDNTLYGDGNVYIATADGADGSTLDVDWMLIGAKDIPTSTAMYEIDTNIPSSTATQDVGGVRNIYSTAGTFTPNVPISSVLDAILFPTIDPVPTNETFSMTLMSSTGVDLNGVMLEMGVPVDLEVNISSTNGSWSPGGENLYGTPVIWDFDMDGDMFSEPTNNKAAKAIGNKVTYTYSGGVNFDAGDAPVDNKGDIRTNMKRTGYIAPVGPMSVTFGYPILMAMLDDKKITRVQLEAYIDRSMCSSVNDGILISETASAYPVTANLLGNIKYPYIMVPTTYSKSFKSLFDSNTNTEYFGELQQVDDFDMAIGASIVSYSAWVFKNVTTITTVDNTLLLTIN